MQPTYLDCPKFRASVQYLIEKEVCGIYELYKNSSDYDNLINSIKKDIDLHVENTVGVYLTRCVDSITQKTMQKEYADCIDAKVSAMMLHFEEKSKKLDEVLHKLNSKPSKKYSSGWAKYYKILFGIISVGLIYNAVY